MMHSLTRLRDIVRDWGTLTVVLTFVISQWTKIERHESILIAFEKHGTPSLVTMQATYDERFRAQDERIKRLETIAISNSTGILDIKGDVKVVLEKIALVKESLEEHRRSEKEGTK